MPLILSKARLKKDYVGNSHLSFPTKTNNHIGLIFII